MAREGIDANDIEQALRGRVDSLVPALLSSAVRDGAHWSVGNVDNERGTQMKIDRAGPSTGLWTDFSESPGTDRYSGDMLKLVAVVLFGGWSRPGAKGSAIAWAKSWLGWDDLDPGRLAKVKSQTAERSATSDREAEEEAKKKQARAYALWAGSVPLAGTPALAYLLGRLPGFERLGKLPGAFRYCPDVWCPVRRGKHPALVAQIIGLDGRFRGVHRTYLDVSAGKSGPVGNFKLPPDPKGRRKSHKLSLGHYQGGCIPLWKGASQATLREIPAGTPVYVSEGVEDGLSVAIATPEARVVAGVALSNMGGLELPPQAGPIVFIGQNDPLNGQAVEAFERIIGRQQAAGRDVKLIFPKPEFKDFNDQLLGKRMGVAA